MRYRRVLAAGAMVGAGMAWYLFRPELLFVNSTVSDALPSAGAQSAGGAVPLATGRFRSAAHATEGTATIYRLADGKRILRLMDFATSNGPDVRVYLVGAADARNNGDVTKAGFVDLGAMRGNRGNQNYAVPPSVDLLKYRAVSIWCRRFSVSFATAPLAAAG